MEGENSRSFAQLWLAKLYDKGSRVTSRSPGGLLLNLKRSVATVSLEGKGGTYLGNKSVHKTRTCDESW